MNYNVCKSKENQPGCQGSQDGIQTRTNESNCTAQVNIAVSLHCTEERRGKKEPTCVTLENDILTGNYKTKDKRIGKVISNGVHVNNSETDLHVNWR